MPSDAGELDFWVTTPSQNGRAALSCGGELDMATAGILREATRHLESDVVIDFSEVTFCDSSGIAALIALSGRLRSLGAGLRVVNVHSNVVRTFEVCGVIAPLGVETTVDHVAAKSPRTRVGSPVPTRVDAHRVEKAGP